MPITWRNINAPNFQGVNNILQSAGRSVQAGISGLDNLLANRAARADQAVADNSQAFLEGLRTDFRDPNAFADALASGEIAQRQAAAGELDSSIVNQGALDNILRAGQQRANTQQTFDDNQTRLNNRGAREAFQVALAEGNFDAAEQIRNENNFLNAGELARDQATSERQAADREQSQADAATRRLREGVRFSRETRNDNQAQADRTERRAEEADLEAKQDHSDSLQSILLREVNRGLHQNAESALNTLDRRLDKSGLDYSSAEREAARNELDQVLRNRVGGSATSSLIAEQDQAVLNEQQRILAQQPEYLNNGFIQEEGTDKRQIAADTLTRVQNIPGMSGSEREHAKDFINSAVDGTITADGQEIPVTSSILNLIVANINTEGRWRRFGEGDLKDLADNLFDSNPGLARQLKQEYNAAQQFKRDKATLESEFTGRAFRDRLLGN